MLTKAAPPTHQEITPRLQRWLKRRLEEKMPVALISRLAEIPRTTLLHEVTLHGGYDHYDPERAAIDREARRQKNFFEVNEDAKEYLVEKLKLGWSPEQIVGRARIEGLFTISVPVVYRFIHKTGEGLELKLWRFLKQKKRTRRKKQTNEVREVKQQSHRIEADTVRFPMASTCLFVMIDTVSRYTVLRKVPVGVSCARAVIETTRETIAQFASSDRLYVDHGEEFAFQELRTLLPLGVRVTFTNQGYDKPFVECQNRMIRQFYPEETRFDEVTDAGVQYVQTLLNQTPRKILGYRTPEEVHTLLFPHFQSV